MTHPDDRELEETLRQLPTAGPPPALRDRILRAAERSLPAGPRPRRLALALCCLALVAVDLAVDGFYSARISRLTGNGQRLAASPTAGLLASFHQRDEMLLALLDREGMK
jgi:hypothetical protein